MTRPALILAALLLVTTVAGAEEKTDIASTYRLRISEEVTGSYWHRKWTAGNLLVATGDSTVDWKNRLTLGAAVGVSASSSDVRVRTREAYARGSLLPWLDVEGGRRIVRWGTGYAFTPSGVLDPPRNATDPQDRLGLNEGVLLAKADAYAGPASITVVASERVHAARVRSTVRGVELAMIGAVDKGRRPSWGANFTHVVGNALEWHGEVLSHEGATGERASSALIGGQYTFAGGPNVVLEYYRSAGRDFAFARVSRGPGELTLSPEVLLLIDLDARHYSVVPSVGLTLADHAQAYVRGAIDTNRSAGSLTAGLSLRF